MRPHKPAELLPSLPFGPDWAARVLDGTPVLLAYLDAGRRFRYANETHRTWLGIDPQQLIGRHVIEVIGRHNYRRAGPALEKAYSGQMTSYEGELFNGDEQRYAHGNFQPDFDAAGHVCGANTRRG